MLNLPSGKDGACGTYSRQYEIDKSAYKPYFIGHLHMRNIGRTVKNRLFGSYPSHVSANLTPQTNVDANLSIAAISALERLSTGKPLIGLP
jgi:hypothetical protein